MKLFANNSLAQNREAIKAIIYQHYGIQITSYKLLAGEVDINIKLNTDQSTSYLLKISPTDTPIQEIDYQINILDHLNQKELPFTIPKMVKTLKDEEKIIIQTADQKHWWRLQTWVAGRMLEEANPKNEKLLYSWGQTCAQLQIALQGFDHPEAHRFYKWNPSESLYSRRFINLLAKEEADIAGYFWQLFEKKALPKLSQLRQGINYNDAHQHNLLVGQQAPFYKVEGVIDFGDCIYTHTVNELAIACAYACMNKVDPIRAAIPLINGFHDSFPLKEEEIEVLFYLIAARLLITVTNSALSKQQEPDNEYLLISEQPAWELLKKLKHISPDYAHHSFRQACGWEANPQHTLFMQWLANTNSLTSPVFIEGKTICNLDLSVSSTSLGHAQNYKTLEKFEQRISSILHEHQTNIGVGGYAEPRPVYTTDAYAIEGNEGPEWRSIHLGLDIWAPAETPVFAPLDGIVHSFHNNANERDYGPTIILEHQPLDGLVFYTLYGHLGLASLDGLIEGQQIKAGQQIATIGHSSINGNWPAHLHFQCILDLYQNKGDFPGVAFPNERAVWLSNSPAPHSFFGLDANCENTNIKSNDDIFSLRKTHLGKSLSLSYQTPLHIVRGDKQYLFDNNGRRYLDTVNNVAHVGHEHPRIVRAGQQQMAVLNTNTRYLHQNIVNFAQAIVDTLPSPLSVVHFVNSGSEANELALRMAKVYSKQKDILAIEAGYHGNTSACIDISSYKFDGKGGRGAPKFTHILPIPDIYRGAHKEKNAGQQYAQYAKKAITTIQSKGRNIAAFIGESILSCGGQIVLPDGYLSNIYKQVRTEGGLCIADEVQVGFGRVGSHFWGFELQNVIPDIVTMGKPIGNGHPLAAVITTPAVAKAFANGMEYFNTFGGNPVSSAIGLEVLNVIKDEKLQQNALRTGLYIQQGLRELQTRHSMIGDVRGHGLFIGFELILDTKTQEPATLQAKYLANRMQELGVLMSVDGPNNNVLKIKPPMCFSQEDANFLLQKLQVVFNENFMSQ